MPKQRLMKDGLGHDAIHRIATALSQADANFPVERFTQYALTGLAGLELKERVQHLINALQITLPRNFEAGSTLLFAVKRHWDYGDENDPLRGFAAWPLIDYVAHHGLNHPQLALALLKHLTPLFSAEFALRPFLIHHFAITYSQLQLWLEDEDEHVRRLVSEGTRPRLPWGPRLSQFIHNPAPVITLLEQLKDDGSYYVRRSVANNLNDISKDHPDLVVHLCLRWQQQSSKECDWIIRHATRTLIKAGHPGSMALLGHTHNPQLKGIALTLNNTMVKMGESLNFTVSLHSSATTAQSLVLDYAIHYMKANGKTRPKVFKLKTFSLAPGEQLTITKECSFREITTRHYYPGDHAIELLINGTPHQRTDFSLTL